MLLYCRQFQKQNLNNVAEACLLMQRFSLQLYKRHLFKIKSLKIWLSFVQLNSKMLYTYLKNAFQASHKDFMKVKLILRIIEIYMERVNQIRENYQESCLNRKSRLHFTSFIKNIRLQKRIAEIFLFPIKINFLKVSSQCLYYQ